ncbi:MAG: DUF4899 domain-containing protein [Thermotogota bacterium]|nr:DUF4899 domain-containing protein [Thermotogota bacterium]
MEFDFFSIKVFAESQSSDEIMLGFFFGKVEGRLEFQFINFARRFKDLAKIDLKKDLNDFKTSLNQSYRKLIARSGDTIPKTNDFSNHLKSYINKNGGRLTFSNKLSTIIKNKDTEAVRTLLRELFDEWTRDVKIRFDWGCSTYNEMSLEESSKTEQSLDIQSAIENTKDRKDLLDMADFYPIVDPMEGNPVASLKVGDSVYLTIVNFNDEGEEQRLVNSYPDKFDEKGKNIKPFEGYITAMEYCSAEKGTVLLKVIIDEWFVAKAFIMSNIRIMQKNRRKNLLKQNAINQDNIPDTLFKKSDKKNNQEEGISRKTLIDRLIISSLIALIVIVILIIVFIFL